MHVTQLETGHPVWISLVVPAEHSQNWPTRDSPFAVSQVSQFVAFEQVRQLKWHLVREMFSSRMPHEPVHDLRLDISLRVSVEARWGNVTDIG